MVLVPPMEAQTEVVWQVPMTPPEVQEAPTPVVGEESQRVLESENQFWSTPMLLQAVMVTDPANCFMLGVQPPKAE